MGLESLVVCVFIRALIPKRRPTPAHFRLFLPVDILRGDSFTLFACGLRTYRWLVGSENSLIITPAGADGMSDEVNLLVEYAIG
ncbi:hypothetical protein KFK09_019519 [Dendrobium nobile]|uniref:Uncharacterized protein n=1 Tax=Dendrobium nobile TaxID=94219 RepID=A0A8T3AQH9_DENNO|nr:hypothetical protein KFK09_019519 [Dendrobium nobile]